MTARERLRKAANILMCLVAVASIGWSGYDVWTTLAARRAIDSACADLVPVGKVLKLPDSGGRIEAHPDGRIEEYQGGGCRVSSTEAADSYGLNRGEGARVFFEAYVGLEPNAGKVEPEDNDLVDSTGNPDLVTPLGGGIPGTVSDNGTTVKLACGGGTRHEGSPVRNVVATTASTNDGHNPFATGRRMPQQTRDLLIASAVETANRLAERLGCPDRLPEPPTGVDPAPVRFQDADRARGTCRWYGNSGLQDSSVWLPTKIAETPADPDVWTERCGLTMTLDQGRKALSEDGDKPADPVLGDEPPGGTGDWWASAQSWFGDTATRVHLDGRDFTSSHARPGTAGHAGRGTQWWASSTCHGKPAVHTLSVGNSVYGNHAAPHFGPVFRAYVTDVTRRHGCTDVTFPRKSEFRAREG